MVIENSPKSVNISFAVYVFTLVFVVGFLIYTYLEPSWAKILYILSTILAVTHIVMLLADLAYFYWNDNAKNVIIRYFKVYPFGRKHIQTEIDKRWFADYKIENKLFGLKKVLTIFMKKNDQNGNPITFNFSVGLLGKAKITALKQQLDKLTDKK